MSLRQRAEELFSAVPPFKKYELYRAVITNPRFPNRSPIFDDEYYAVRTWRSGTSGYSRNNYTLGHYIESLAESSLTPTPQEVEEFKKTMYEIYIEEIKKLLPITNTLKNIPRAREGMEARKVWNTYVNLPYTSGPGRNFAAEWPKTVAPNRTNSRRLTMKLNNNRRKSRKRSKTRKH